MENIQYIDIEDKDLGLVQAVVELIPGSPGDWYTPAEQDGFEINCWRSGWSGGDLQGPIGTALTIIHGKEIGAIMRQRLIDAAQP